MKAEQKTPTEQETATEHVTSYEQRSEMDREEENDLDTIEEEHRRLDKKRAADQIDESRPRKRRKVKFPRLEEWGEFKEQEQDTDSITTIQDYVQTEMLVEKADQGWRDIQG